MKKVLKIDKPCNENWNEMTPVEQGRHCRVCAKKVVDFSENSHDEIITFLSAAEGQTCGRFKENQIAVYGHKKSSKNIPIYKSIAASFLAIIGFGTSTSVAQEREIYLKGDVAIQPNEEVVKNQFGVTIKGTVLSHNKPVNKAKISLFTNGKLILSVLSNDRGEYTLVIDKETLINNRFTVKVFASGLSTKTIEDLKATKEEITLNIAMEVEHMIMGKIHVEPEKEVYKKGKVSIIEK